MTQWFALVVPAQKELDARDLLTKLGYEAMVPVEVKWRRRNRYCKRRDERPYPLLTRYVFLGVEGQPDWWRLRGLEFQNGRPVIQHVLGSGGWPRPLPPEAVSALKGLDFAIPVSNPHKAIKVGGEAQIVVGAFCGHVGRVRKIVAKRAQVLLTVLNSLMEISVPLEILEAA